ncbi:MAG: pyridoxamine 5'-phosphate oxidase family protein [Dehalococcoidia bacterium]|uniref:MSMEG_1061 family FMN-dependent PPOX-type flavoprotein n=1 Tax=Candidatus Amarobacter glycogenicus TaxID=3140699 RepID=UPI001DCD2213|nr:pyridoxamine 5'-phosphate oxidase family protein [Dehalococcoidia bacterium]MBK7126853.1 pyridoxamine 5'-phosphate oxidase family protein [Dehalococcoidia bacterium]MBK7330695.1 pyridoxamine 5'-phosphate oxidase family protein [Dehalococcoidia bacterium]MBK7724446.1 pyridoxamine 5'-phosphate oxidase family protein [Dehalococcoidia bacterium]MBK9546694.1 pyridoxamine 5'-phosphate oxidase family protein [Dehalococcoidia bacterium]
MVSFVDVISSEDALREIIPPPRGSGAWDKSLTFIDPHAAAFIAKSPFAMIATTSAGGKMDISPKGDPAGFIRVLDEHTLAIPDRPGNGRADTFRNLLENPRVSVYFLVPGRSETLRVNGFARLVKDRWLLEEMAVKGHPAQLAIAVTVEEAFFHCAKCVVRSNLWDAGAWGDASELASLGAVMRDQLKLQVPAEAIEAGLQKDIETRLY